MPSSSLLGHLPRAPTQSRGQILRPGRSPGRVTPVSSQRLESPFSIEALLARPDPRTPAASLLSVSACAASGLCTAASWPRARAVPWACPAAWMPAYLSVGLYQPCPQPAVLGLRMAHFCGLQGLSVTGLELAHCPGLWSSPDRAPAEDLQDTKRPQKRVRTMFNLEQLEELEKVFAKQHNLVGKKRAQLAAQLNLTENQVRVWFQNRRVKYQKQQRLKPPAVSAMTASPSKPSSSLDTSMQREDTKSGANS
ncbi:PREDICTED: homeobox protein notochord [Condylura cristata]|uniref:homeobox protein notochord n=1 Tax=Condylura cristata TaxID=143302 RepID=UPI00033472D6|nr:PREDICTED: homeobox protein notochord [Condylura cristata]